MTRELAESWQTIVTNLPITTTDYDFDFLKYTGNNHDCAILYDYNFKVKVEIYSNSNVFCSDESSYFSIINPPLNIALDSLNCIKHISWDNDFTPDLGYLADGYNIYRSNINTPDNWTKVGKTYIPIWQTEDRKSVV